MCVQVYIYLVAEAYACLEGGWSKTKHDQGQSFGGQASKPTIVTTNIS